MPGKKRTTKRSKTEPPKATGAGVWWIYAVLSVVTCALYWQVRHFEFVNYDDPDYVVGNPQVKAGLSAAGLHWAITSRDAANWFPLTRLSHMLDVQLFRMDAGMHHLTSVFLYAVSVLLLFAVLHRATRARWPSAFVALMFAVHPLHVESVAWVAERKDVLAGLFWFVTLWAYVYYAEKPNWLRYGATVGAFCLGLLSKPSVVSLPFVLLLLDFWPLRRSWRIREKIPFFALSAVSAAWTYAVQQNSRAVKELSVFPLGLRIENALVSYCVYLSDTLWPRALAVFYPYPASIPVWQAIGAAAILVGVSVAVFQFRKTQPYLAMGWCWFLITLVPTIGLVQAGVQARADRYMFVPLVGLLIMIAWGGTSLLRILGARMLGVAAVAAAAGCAAACVNQIGYWQNSETLFAHAVAVTRGNFVAEHNLGLAIAADPSRGEEAIAHYRAALAIRPQSVEANTDLGTALAQTGDLTGAAAAYGRALAEAPDAAIPHNNLGNVFFRMGKMADAIREYRAAIGLQPEYAEALNNLGAALASSGQMRAAVEEFRQALQADPDYAQARTNLDLATQELKKE